MGGLGRETLRILFFDADRMLIADEQSDIGTMREVDIEPRLVIRRALELEAAAIILVHNHPGGDPGPSDADIEASWSVGKLACAFDIDLLEHVIIAADAHYLMSNAMSWPRPRGRTKLTLRDRHDDHPPRRMSDDYALAYSNAQLTRRRRLLRRQLLDNKRLLGEPAWEVLLDLFLQQCEGKHVSTSAACIASGLPMTSGLRLVQRLAEEGYVVREADRLDRRRIFIRLSPWVAHVLIAYFSEGHE